MHATSTPRAGWMEAARRAVLAVAVGAVLAAPAVAHADGVDQTCELSATRFDADSVNVLFPDSSAQYWSTRYTAVPGTRIRIDGVFPYARYTSWNVYDPLLRPFAKESDFELQPDAGSANPFVPGADPRGLAPGSETLPGGPRPPFRQPGRRSCSPPRPEPPAELRQRRLPLEPRQRLSVCVHQPRLGPDRRLPRQGTHVRGDI